MLTVVADEPHLGSPAPHQTAQQTKEDPLELVAEDAVDDEVDGAVDGDEKVVGLSERMILMTKMLQQIINFPFIHLHDGSVLILLMMM